MPKAYWSLCILGNLWVRTRPLLIVAASSAAKNRARATKFSDVRWISRALETPKSLVRCSQYFEVASLSLRGLDSSIIGGPFICCLGLFWPRINPILHTFGVLQMKIFSYFPVKTYGKCQQEFYAKGGGRSLFKGYGGHHHEVIRLRIYLLQDIIYESAAKQWDAYTSSNLCWSCTYVVRWFKWVVDCDRIYSIPQFASWMLS